MRKALLVASLVVLCVVFAPLVAQGSTTEGAGSSRYAVLTAGNMTASVSVPTILDNSTNISLTVTLSNDNVTDDWYGRANITIENNGTTANSTGWVLVGPGNETVVYFNFTVGTFDTNASATVNITFDGSDDGVTSDAVDYWESTTQFAYGDDFAMGSTVALILSILPIVLLVVAFAAIFKTMGKAGKGV